MMYKMLGCFDLVFAQSEGDTQRFRSLGARDVRSLGNLKFDASTLPCNEADLFALQQEIGERPVWLASSTHEGEEEHILKAHNLLIKYHPELLTIIAPRHPERGDKIAQLLSPAGKTALRSHRDKIDSETKFYIADTLGELGLFYRLSEIVFMGGSLVEHGGQNPLEPAHLRCCVLTGPHTKNFADIFSEMEKNNIAAFVSDGKDLGSQVGKLLQNSDIRTQMQMQAKEWLMTKEGVIARILNVIAPIFVPIARS